MLYIVKNSRQKNNKKKKFKFKIKNKNKPVVFSGIRLKLTMLETMGLYNYNTQKINKKHNANRGVTLKQQKLS